MQGTARLALAFALAPRVAQALPAFARHDDHGHDPERERLIAQADAALIAGRAGEALEIFERAALIQHAADAELGIVRAQMALGQYRRALGFCAHTAAAHRDEPGGLALYAWLLHAGGQAAIALRLLDEAIARLSPPAPVLVQTRAALSTPWPLAQGVLRERPWQLAPDAWTATGDGPTSEDTGVAATAVLLADGALAVAPRARVEGAARLWVRNGLGQTVAAAVSGDADPDLVLLRLDRKLPAPTWRRAPREPFAGSPGGVFAYAVDATGRSAWPLSWQGFFAGVPGSAATRPLGLPAPAGSQGGPVLDAAGRWVGIVVEPAGQGDRRLVGVQRLEVAFGTLVREPPSDATPASPLTSFDAHYEDALRGTLQVLVTRRR